MIELSWSTYIKVSFRVQFKFRNTIILTTLSPVFTFDRKSTRTVNCTSTIYFRSLYYIHFAILPFLQLILVPFRDIILYTLLYKFCDAPASDPPSGHTKEKRCHDISHSRPNNQSEVIGPIITDQSPSYRNTCQAPNHQMKGLKGGDTQQRQRLELCRSACRIPLTWKSGLRGLA